MDAISTQRTNNMICDFDLNINNYEKRILSNYTIFPYTCPKCKARKRFIRHGSYKRHVCYLDDNCQRCEADITILRLFCKSCLTTHAILAGNIIPYKYYDSNFHLQIFNEYFVLKSGTIAISQKYRISPRYILHIIKCFCFFSIWVYLILRPIVSDVSAIDRIITIIIVAPKEFWVKFFNNSKWFFLMTKFWKNKLTCPVYINVYSRTPTQSDNR